MEQKKESWEPMGEGGWRGDRKWFRGPGRVAADEAKLRVCK
jgi:hypothetical protein